MSMPYYDLSNPSGVSVFSDALVPRVGATESTPNGFFDFVDRGASTLGNLAREYFSVQSAREATQPERVTEYTDIPRDIAGGQTAIGGGGVSVSWQVVALVALAAMAYLATAGKT